MGQRRDREEPVSSYRRKVTIVEAEQYLGDIITGVCVRSFDLPCHKLGTHVHTMHNDQSVRLEVGDWVLPEPDGEHYYPVLDSYFQENYEAV